MRPFIQMLKQCSANVWILKDTPKPLGRWRTESCPQQMNHKIDLSNEDHCGPCGHYALEKTLFNKKI